MPYLPHNIIETRIDQPANHPKVESQKSQTTSSYPYRLRQLCQRCTTTYSKQIILQSQSKRHWCVRQCHPSSKWNATTIGHLSTMHVWKEQQLRSSLFASPFDWILCNRCKNMQREFESAFDWFFFDPGKKISEGRRYNVIFVFTWGEWLVTSYSIPHHCNISNCYTPTNLL